MIRIKFNNFHKATDNKFHNEELNEVITTFVIHVMLNYARLSWIIKKNKNLDFYIEQTYDKWTQNVPWYNKTLWP